MSVVKKKKFSKKNKSSWRKHTDIKDVEEFLEEQRQTERIGTFIEKKDSELFAVDATPFKKKAVLTERQKRKANALKPARSLQILENTSKVQDPIVKRNHVKQKKNGRIIEEEVRNPSAPRHVQANKDRLRYYEKLDKKLSNREKGKIFNADIWEEKDFRDAVPGLKDEKGWISKDLSLHVVKNLGKPVIKVHDSIRHKTTKAKTFEAPHPGMSYNPTLKAHQDLIATVVEKEEKIIKEEKHLKRVTTEMFSKGTLEQRNRQWIKEMTIQEGEPEEEKSIADSDTDLPYKKINPPVVNKKKTRQIRNKEQRHKELTKKTAEKKALKKQIAEINRLKSIKSEIVNEEEKLNVLKKHRKQLQVKKKFQPKRLGRLKYSEPEVDVNMAEDIPGNLRNVKTESSLLIDRFKNLQKRNILPASVYVGRRKPTKIKRFVRSSHKEPEVSIFNKK